MTNATSRISPTDAFRSLAVATSIVVATVVLEYVALMAIQPDMFQRQFCSQIDDFAILNDNGIGAFVIRDDIGTHDQCSARFRVGFIRLQDGEKHGEFVTQLPNPMRVVPRERQSALIVGCWDGSITHIDRPGEINSRLRLCEQRVGHMCSLLFSDECNTVIIRGVDEIVVQSADTGDLLWRRSFDDCMALDCHGSRLFCGKRTGEVLQIDGRSGKEECVCARHDESVYQVVVSPCGNYLACILKSGRLVMTSLSDGKSLWTCKASMIIRPAFSSDGSRLVVADLVAPRRMFVTDTRTGNQLFALDEHRELAGVRCAADGNIYSWGSDGYIRAWNLDRGQLLWQCRPDVEKPRKAFLAMFGVPLP